MICPLMLAGFLGGPDCGAANEYANRLCQCRGDDCAWWLPGLELCSIRAIGARSALIGELLRGELLRARGEETH